MLRHSGGSMMTRPTLVLALLAAGGIAYAAAAPQGGPATVPLGLDLHVPFPADNPITAAKADLGRRLFFETRISADGETACATCHRPELAFTDGRRVPEGVYGREGQRNTPSILNRAYGERFFWDGRAATLEQQVADAQAGATDLGLPPDEAAGRLRGDPGWEEAFTAAFAAPGTSGREARPITGERLIAAIATFVRTQLSGDSPADRYAAGDRRALAPGAKRGHAIFYGKGGCGMCHSGPLFSDEGLHNTGVSWGSVDTGGHGVTGEERDRGRFKTPSLRNVALTAPYMHDGSIGTLEQVVDFYDRGAGPNPNLDSIVRPLGLSPGEKAALLEFLRSLTRAAAAPETTAIVGATLFDGTGAPSLEDATPDLVA